MSHYNENERAFFIVLNCNDIWITFKKFIYVNKKKSNIYDYRDGDTAAFYGYLGILQINRKLWFTQRAMNLAAEHGHLEVVKWLHENRKEGCSTTAMNLAAEHDHLEIVKWLHENRKEGCTTHAMDRAAENGYLDIIKWLHENRKEGCSKEAMDRAAEKGHLDIVIWLNENRKEGCTIDAMDQASVNGHLDIVKCLYYNNKKCALHAMYKALECDRAEIAKWLCQQRIDLLFNYGHFKLTEQLRKYPVLLKLFNTCIALIRWPCNHIKKISIF
jgi:hypothetical protein